MMGFLWIMWNVARSYRIAGREPVYIGRIGHNGAVEFAFLFARGRKANFINQAVNQLMENQGCEFREASESQREPK